MFITCNLKIMSMGLSKLCLFKEVRLFKLYCFILFYIFIVIACDKLPDEQIVQRLPSYYNVYLDGRAKEILQAKDQMEDCEAFFWITDIHWEPDLNARRAPAMIRYLATKTGIDKILNGGDTGNSSVICSNAIDRLRDAIGSDRVYTVNGNHEMNDASRYECPYERAHKVLRGHCEGIVYGDKNKSYFFFENAENKVRYIGLSTYGLFINNHYKNDYTEEQLQWFTETALNVEKGWTVVVFTHALYVVDPYTNSCNVLSQLFVDAIDYYQGNGKIACVLMGDSHIDRVHIGKTGVPYIISQCDRTEPYHGDINVPRVSGTISENHFEVVLIDKKKQEVRLYSIGSDARDGVEDEVGEMVNLRVLNY